MNLKMKDTKVINVSVAGIKRELEQNTTFQYWNKAIGLTFDEFSIIDLDREVYIKEGKKEIGDYDILVKDGKIYSIGFCMNNELVRLHTLKLVSKSKEN